ncbi:CRISPR-associated protein Cas5, partial [Frankia sp. CcWB3]
MSLPGAPDLLGGERDALEVTVSAPIVSFRDPLYSAVAVTLPCPAPATVGGMLAAVAGGWDEVDPEFRFAMAFSAQATGVDLETHHPLESRGAFGQPVPRERQFLAFTELTVWIVDEVERWERRFRRPVWPLRLGRSQDLATARTRRVRLSEGEGVAGGALVPDDPSSHGSSHGSLLRLPTAVSRDRARTRWDAYRHRLSVAAGGQLRPQSVEKALVAGWVTTEGRAVHLLPPT